MSTQGDPMNADEFARAAYPLLHEGIVLLRAHAGEGPAIERFVAMVENVRAQHRAARDLEALARNMRDVDAWQAAGCPSGLVTGMGDAAPSPAPGISPVYCRHCGGLVVTGSTWLGFDGLPVCSSWCVTESHAQRRSIVPGYTKPTPAPAPDVYDGPVTAGMRFGYKGNVFVPDGRRGKHGEFLDAEGSGISEPNLRGMYRPIPAPAPEPSAPPDGVPVCEIWCGKVDPECVPSNRHFHRTGVSCFGPGPECWCSLECMDANRPLNPPPSDPVTVATGGVPAADEWGVPYCTPWCWMDLYDRRVPDNVNGDDHPWLVIKGEETHAACSQTCKVAGYPINPRPIDTARSVPPGPVPVGARRDCSAKLDELRAKVLEATHLPAAPASEPAVRPLSERLQAFTAIHVTAADVRQWSREVAALEQAARYNCDMAGMAIADMKAARAEVEQLRGKLAEVERGVEIIRTQAGKYGRERDEERTVNDAVAAHARVAEQQATARVRSMREAAAKAVTCSHCGKRPATCVGAYEDAKGDSPACDHCCAHGNEDGRCEPIDGPAVIRALPLDTGTATDTGGEAQADAIKAAVDKERERCLAWFDWYHAVPRGSGRSAPFRAGIRSGEDAPGAVTPAKGTP